METNLFSLCNSCGANGKLYESEKDCSHCNGTGRRLTKDGVAFFREIEDSLEYVIKKTFLPIVEEALPMAIKKVLLEIEEQRSHL